MNTTIRRVGNSFQFTSHDPAEGRKRHHKHKHKTSSTNHGHSKKQRQAWWNNLSDHDKAAYLERVQAKKAQKRQEQSLKLMAGKHFNCALCIHGLTHSCTDNLPHGCVYFYDANANTYGPAYK